MCTTANCLLTLCKRVYLCNLAFSISVCLQLQKESEGKEVAVAAALQQSAFLKAQLQDERECHAWLAQQHEQVSSYFTQAVELLTADMQWMPSFELRAHAHCRG